MAIVSEIISEFIAFVSYHCGTSILHQLQCTVNAARFCPKLLPKHPFADEFAGRKQSAHRRGRPCRLGAACDGRGAIVEEKKSKID